MVWPRLPQAAAWWVPLALLAIAGCDRSSSGQNSTDLPLVRITTPEHKEVIDYVYYTGRSDSPKEVEIRARVTGYLKHIDYEPGAEVEVHQRLFKVDPEIYQAKYDQAEGQIQLAQAQLKLAKANYARALEVAKTPGAISQREVDQYAAQEEEAEAQLVVAKANALEAKEYLDFTNVLSPIEGQAGRNLLAIGNLVTQDSTLLATVVSQDPMWVYFAVDEPTMLRFRKLVEEGKIHVDDRNLNYPVDIGLSDEENAYPHGGKVDYVSPEVDATTGTLQVRGVFKNPKDAKDTRLLKPGMFVRVRLPLGGPHEALVIDQQAINSDQDQKYLLAVNDEDVVEYRPIELGSQQPGGKQVVIPVQVVKVDNGVRVATGDEHGVDSVTATDRIIVSGLQRVRPGTKVRMAPLQKDAADPGQDTAATGSES